MLAWFIIPAIAAGLIVVLLLVVLNPKQKYEKPHNECVSDAAPCIEIAEPGGASYRLNDFRFEPNHCIGFLSLPDHVMRNYCGNYNLTWIGPQGRES